MVALLACYIPADEQRKSIRWLRCVTNKNFGFQIADFEFALIKFWMVQAAGINWRQFKFEIRNPKSEI